MKNSLKTGLIAAAMTLGANVASANCTIVLPFANGSAALSQANQSVLEALIANDPSAAVTVTGHTNATGSAATNQRLANARVAAVTGYLSASSNSVNVVSSQAVASRTPVSGSAAADSVNRRVEIFVHGCNPAAYSVLSNTTQVAAGNAGLFGGLGNVGVGGILAGALIVGAAVDASDGS
jgi:hypothetical protein